jgi:hypothetical protein
MEHFEVVDVILKNLTDVHWHQECTLGVRRAMYVVEERTLYHIVILKTLLFGMV